MHSISQPGTFLKIFMRKEKSAELPKQLWIKKIEDTYTFSNLRLINFLIDWHRWKWFPLKSLNAA